MKCSSLLVPSTPEPLAVLETSFFPKLTTAIISKTSRFLPGSTPFVSSSVLPNKQNSFQVENSAVVINFAPTNEFTVTTAQPNTSSNLAVDEEKYPSPTRERRFIVSSNPHLRFFIHFVLVTSFFVLLLVCLAFDGYLAEIDGKRALTIYPTQRFWTGDALQVRSAVRCGENALECRPFATEYWFGIHCLSGAVEDEPVIRGGGGDAGRFYTSDSYICSSAVHAGMYDPNTGGCFEMRLAGEQLFFVGVEQNGLKSTSFGAFPRSLQFRKPSAESTNYCSNTSWSADFVSAVYLFGLLVLWRVSHQVANWTLVQAGFLLAGFKNHRETGEFMPVLNELLNKQFTLIPMVFMLFSLFGTRSLGFCPDPQQFPLEAVGFALVFFTTIHLHDLELALDLSHFTLTPNTFARGFSTSVLVFVIILGVLGLALVGIQFRILYRAGLLPLYLGGFGLLALSCVILATASYVGQLQFHFHHFFLGLVLCAIGRSQKVVSLLIQAIGIGLFVEGLAVYDTAPLFDEGAGRFSGYSRFPDPPFNLTLADVTEYRAEEYPIFTSARFLANDTIELKWALPTELALTWDCDNSVGDVVPEMYRTLFALQEAHWEVPKERGNSYFYMIRNGILQNHAMIERTFTQKVDPDLYLKEPLVFNVALTDGYVYGVDMLPMPFPLDRQPYHAPDADLCERLYGIYSKLGALRNHTELVWWKME